MTKLVSKLKKFNQIQGITNYNVTNLTVEQYNQVYLELCDMYKHVNQNYANVSMVSGKILGYIACDNN